MSLPCVVCHTQDHTSGGLHHEKSPSPHNLILPSLSPCTQTSGHSTAHHVPLHGPEGNIASLGGSKSISKKQRRKSMNGRKSKTADTIAAALAGDDDSTTSYSSSGSDSEGSLASGFSKRASVRANKSAKRMSRKAVSHTALETANSVIFAATESIKSGYKKNVKHDLVSHGKHILLTAECVIPHIHLTVDKKSAAEIQTNARLVPKLYRAATAPNVDPGTHTAERLVRDGIPEEIARGVCISTESDNLPGFAKRTMASLIHDTEVQHNHPLAHVPHPALTHSATAHCGTVHSAHGGDHALPSPHGVAHPHSPHGGAHAAGFHGITPPPSRPTTSQTAHAGAGAGAAPEYARRHEMHPHTAHDAAHGHSPVHHAHQHGPPVHLQPIQH